MSLPPFFSSLLDFCLLDFCLLDFQSPPLAFLELREVRVVQGEFTLGELERACPGVSRDMVRRVLRQLQKKGRVACLGRGPSAHWRRKGNTLKRGQ